jgi:hypothetical protein
MLKKWLFGLTVTMLFLLGGCSLLNDATNTVTYIKNATDYLNKATIFATEASPLAKKAVTDPQAAGELEIMLKEMKQEIEIFNGLQAPELASDLHQQLVSQNNVIAQGIDLYLENIKNGKLDPSVLENTKIFQTVQEISGVIDQIKKLGQ